MNPQTTEIYSNLDEIFSPKSVAVVGASPSKHAPGAFLLLSLIEFGYKGRLYPVNLRGESVHGLQAYPSVRDIPGPVDMVIIATPANTTVQVMEDCIAKKVKVVTLFTAGFSETGLGDRSELEKRMRAKAREAGVRIVGPNCMGIYSPKGGITFAGDFPRESGPVGVICQSGGHTNAIVREGATRGVRFSKVVSYGNASDINETELLEYFARDPETKVIACYIEGVKDGQRFIAALEKATKAKPVIVMKGGETEAGTRTVMSHTASLAGSREVWSWLLKQKGAQQVYSVAEMIDTLLPHVFMNKPNGRNTALVGVGGGASVVAADACSKANLMVPVFPSELQQKLSTIVPADGNIIVNPADVNTIFWNSEALKNAVHIIGSWQGIDLLIMHVSIDVGPRPMTMGILGPLIEAFVEGAKLSGKPCAAVVQARYTVTDHQIASELMEKCYRSGLPVFGSVTDAAGAIDKFIRYNERVSQID